jgi:inorganic triphosphatase YgiF
MALEIEIKLIMAGDDPPALLKELASLPGIGPFSFRHKRTRMQRDTYYDTDIRSLSGQGIALRTREESDSIFLTVKRNEHVDERGASTREELEFRVSEQNLPRITQVLEGLPIITGGLNLRTVPIRKSLEDLGLVPIQDRQTERTLLEVTSSLESGKTVSELVLDTVCYKVGGAKVLHYELEVEAFGPEYQPMIIELTELLKQAYRDKLRRWDHNKLLTGFALEKLYALRKTDADGEIIRLDAETYDAIDAILKNAF